MDEKSFKLEIITPQRVVYSDAVTSFTAPGVMGGFQVLHNHAPMLSALAVGETKLRDEKGVEHRFATSGGFVEVKQNLVVMLADSAEHVEDIDLPRAERARERATNFINGKHADTDVERAQLALARALNRIRVAKRD